MAWYNLAGVYVELDNPKCPTTTRLTWRSSVTFVSWNWIRSTGSELQTDGNCPQSSQDGPLAIKVMESAVEHSPMNRSPTTI